MEEGDNIVNNIYAVHFLIMNCSHSNLIMIVTQVAPVQFKRRNVRIIRSDEEINLLRGRDIFNSRFSRMC